VSLESGASKLRAQCPNCSAPYGPGDRICFACHRTLPATSEVPHTTRTVPASYGSTRHSPSIPSADSPTERTAPSPPSPPNGSSLSLELQWGRTRTALHVPPAGCTIGSTEAADVVVPAPFLAPIHARIVPRGSSWSAEPVTPEGLVLLRGAAVSEAVLNSGDVLRLADRVGNFATIRVLRDAKSAKRISALRGELPDAGQTLVIGSGPTCGIRLDHPLVRPRHALLRRDPLGLLWLEDRTTVAGTYVNGKRLKGRIRLAASDVIQVGPSSARVGLTALEPLEQVRGVDVCTEGACVEVDLKQKGQRRLLSDVTLHLPPASLTAVAGPSGAGKTTLMRLLSGQTGVSAGSVSYNGIELSQCREAHAALMAFVPQDDVVHPDLTVAEALGFQARLRLGRDVPAITREASIRRALGFVGLEEQSHQLVKTLSGGQRKRVSIASELLNEPEILFLDEPTSGLDPGLDKRMMLLLRLLADQGRTVVLTTHAIAHVDVCDTLVLVGPGGYVIYAGPPEEASAWFGVPSLGDIFSLVETPDASSKAAIRQSQSLQIAASRPDPVTSALPGGQAKPLPLAEGASGIARPPFGSPAWRETIFHQGRIFAERYVKLLTRDRTALAFSLLQGVAVALLTALVAPKPLVWNVKGNAPMFIFGCSAVWFGMINAVRELVKERTIWRREELSGANPVAYLSSKVVVLGVIAAIQSLSILIVLDLTLGLPSRSPVGSPFVGIGLTLWLANLSGMAIGLLVSALAPSSDRAMSIVPYLLITQLVLCGVLLPLGAVTPLSWLMPARWAVSALGSVAGLSAVALHQSSGLYPSSAIGLIGNWLALLVLATAGVAATGRILNRQAAQWSVG
jgi:ABC transport system ATP-binding/permease protein